MDLYHHSNPPFTRWVIGNGFLHEKFVVIDVGCQGGEHPRWDFLGDQVEVYGFDPIAEVIDALRQIGRPSRHYFPLALADEDGEREFLVRENTFESSFFDRASTVAGGAGEIRRGRRMVPVRRLDTLFADNRIPLADYIKLDCEGAEAGILRGAREYLAASGPLCVTSESNFCVSPIYPRSHFQALNDILVEHRLLVIDVNMVRQPRPAYAGALIRQPRAEPDIMADPPQLDVGAAATLDVVFCRDLVAEVFNAGAYSFAAVPAGPHSADRLIKAMINYELHGLMDCALEIAVQFRGELQQRFDVEEAGTLLLTRPPEPRNTADVANCVQMIGKLRAGVEHHRRDLAQRNYELAQRNRELVRTAGERDAALAELDALYRSHSWQITAPMRTVRTWLRR